MDQAHDFVCYIHQGLRAIGYHGVGGLPDGPLIGVPLEEASDGNVKVLGRNGAVMLLWGKDMQARITIEVGDPGFGYPEDSPHPWFDGGDLREP